MSNRRNRERDREIGALICFARLMLGMSCPELGRRLDVTGQQIRKYEIGGARVAASTLDDLAVALQKTAIWFLEADHEAVSKAACLKVPEHAAKRRQFLHAVAVPTPGVNGAPRPFATVAEPSADGRRAPMVMSRLFKLSKDRGYIRTNPCERGGRLYESDRVDKVWSEEELGRLFAVCSPEVHDVVVLALWTGQRQGDLLRLTWVRL